MLVIEVPEVPDGSYDETTNEFIAQPAVTLELEHSLVSLSKWESIVKKPFLEGDLTSEETIEYVKAMTLNSGVPDEVYNRLSHENVQEISDYIQDPHTATWFPDEGPQRPGREKYTAELIYYWMIAYGIAFECETWHLNRLFTLIRICNLKQQKPKPVNTAEAMDQRRKLNEQRKAELGIEG